jgi:hypothetical protein
MKKLILVFIISFSVVSGFGQDTGLKFDPYISVRAFFGYHKAFIPENDKAVYTDNETDLIYRLQANSRFGVNFTSGKVRGVAELGLQNHSTATTSGNYVYLRLANITYDFGLFQITLGQDYTPYTWCAIDADYADDNNMTGFGASYDGRQPLLRIESQGFYIVFISPGRTVKNGSAYSGTGSDPVLGSYSGDTTALFPKTAAGYDYKSNGFIAGFGGAINAVKINDSVEDSTPPVDIDGKTILSYIAYLHGDMILGIIRLRLNFAFGQNAGNFGIVLNPGVSAGNFDSITYDADFLKNSAYAFDDGGSVKNSRHMEGYINVIIKFTGNFQAGVAAGYQSDKLDMDKAEADRQVIYAVDLKYSVDKNLSFSPAFSYRDYMKDINGEEQGSEYYAGVKVQFDIY